MFYPQSNFHSQAIGYPQGLGYSQGAGYPQGFGSQSSGYPQGNFGQQGFPGTSNIIPFSNTLYGYPQLTPSFAPGLPQTSNWQHPAQQQAQQQAMLHTLASQLAPPFTQQHLQGTNAFAGSANGAAQSTGAWQQPQAGAEQFNPALQLQSQLQSQQLLLQRLAQYHYLVAQQLQQLAQLAAQQPTQVPGNPYTGQFMPSQLGANFVPGITMH
jgi:hypothetical protein